MNWNDYIEIEVENGICKVYRDGTIQYCRDSGMEARYFPDFESGEEYFSRHSLRGALTEKDYTEALREFSSSRIKHDEY